MAYLYRHIRLDTNEVFYIGVGTTPHRAYTKFGRNKHWGNIVNKTKYDIDIIIDDLSYDNALKKEKEFITLYGRKDLNKGTLVNMTDGGDGTIGVIFTEERIEKMLGNKHMLNKKHAEETKSKIREKMGVGKNCRMYGKKQSIETIKKRTAPNIGRKRSAEIRKILSLGKIGSKNPMYGKRGKNHPSFGKKVSANTRKLMSEKKVGKSQKIEHIENVRKALSKPIFQFDKNMVFKKEWPSAKIAGITLGIQSTSISSCCRGKLKSAGNYIWKLK